MKGPEVFSKYVGDSEKAIRDVFMKARLNSPCIIFFDEIDSIASKRGESTDVSDRVLVQLLTEIDGFQEINDVIVVGATNRPALLDEALIRPGRLNELIYITLPDEQARESILKIGSRGMTIGAEVDMKKLAKQTEGYTGAELIQICQSAGYNSLKRSLEDDTIKIEDFEQALKEIKPRISKQSIHSYESFFQNNSLFK